jgi:uncharacterized membrane protein
MWRRTAPAERDATAPRAPARPLHGVLRVLGGMVLVLLPIIAWLARTLGAPRLGDALALFAVALVVIAAGRALGVVATTAFGALVVVLVLLARVAGVPAVYGPPIVINLAVASVFAASLRGDALVTRFARAAEGVLTPEVERYSRRLTRVWALYLAVLGAIGIAIAVHGDERWGAWWSGIVDYLLVAALFVGELAWRRGSIRGIAHQVRSVRAAMRPPAS